VADTLYDGLSASELRAVVGVPRLELLDVVTSTLDVAQREMSDSGKPSGDNYLLKVDNALVVPVNKKVRVITTLSVVATSSMPDS